MDEEKQRKAELEKWNHTKNLLQMNYQPSVEEFKNTHSQILKDIKIKNEQSKCLRRKLRKMEKIMITDSNGLMKEYYCSKNTYGVNGKIFKNEYSFRGNLNIQKVILDTIKDQKIGFIAIEKETFVFGITNSYSDFLPIDFSSIFSHESPIIFENYKYGFLIYSNLPKKGISDVIKFINGYKKQVEKLPHEITKEIKKSNKEHDKNGIKRQTVTVKVF